MEDQLLSITEVGRATGLPSSALRYYEREKLLEPAARAGGRRHYRPEVLQRLAVIGLLREVGFTIAEIRELVAVGEWRSLAERKLAEIDAQAERLHTARDLLTSALACDCSSLDECELVGRRRGRHRRATEALRIAFGPPGDPARRIRSF